MIEGLYPVSALGHVCFFIRFCDYDKFQTDAERANIVRYIERYVMTQRLIKLPTILFMIRFTILIIEYIDVRGLGQILSLVGLEPDGGWRLSR